MALTSITPTAHQLRALTHPVRLRMLGLLRVEGPATATTLATRLGLNTGAASYHLRQLAQHGFIVDDAERGNGRERWWRAAHSSTRTELPDPADRDAQETGDAYLQAVATVYAEQLQRAVEERALLPQAWRDASTFSDYHVRVTPRRAALLVETLDRLLSDLDAQESGDDGDDGDDEPATFVVQINAYPRPGTLTEDPS